MNYGQSQAVMVLAGERLGLPMTTADLARRVLSGDALHPMILVAIEREATALNNRIRKRPDQVATANQHCAEIIGELGLTA